MYTYIIDIQSSLNTKYRHISSTKTLLPDNVTDTGRMLNGSFIEVRRKKYAMKFYACDGLMNLGLFSASVGRSRVGSRPIIPLATHNTLC